MNNSINKIRIPFLDGEGKVTKWKFGLECICSGSETSAYAEGVISISEPKLLTNWSKSDIDNLFNSLGLEVIVDNKIESLKACSIANENFSYDALS